tara:strand:- start:758 stop:946 length:189 start_codon:yes stop_codon:yes gene_type:complete
MNIISCDNCGALLDGDVIEHKLYDNIYAEDGSVDPEKGTWSQEHDDHVAFTPCPVCQEPVTL